MSETVNSKYGKVQVVRIIRDITGMDLRDCIAFTEKAVALWSADFDITRRDREQMQKDLFEKMSRNFAIKEIDAEIKRLEDLRSKI